MRLESGAAIVMKTHDENELPGPPSKPQVTDVTKNSVSLSWQPGLVGASPVSSYVIEAFRFVSIAGSLKSPRLDWSRCCVSPLLASVVTVSR